MIEEAYCSFETCKLLKEKGFNEPCYEWYNPLGSHYNSAFAFNNEDYKEIKKICAPTQQMAMRWLREVHHLYIQVMLDSWALGGHMGYYVVIQNTTSDFEMMLQDALDDVFYNTYEEACEAAIKYCLENLIK